MRQIARPRIAWLSPLPPQQSGIANYSYQLIKSLRAEIDLHLFCDPKQVIPELANDFTIHSLSTFGDLYREYDDVVYHLGNNAGFHKRIYELAWKFPGTIVLHDYNLTGFMHGAFYRHEKMFRQALHSRPNNGDTKARAITDLLRPVNTPMSDAIVSRSRRLIVHHQWVRNQFAEHLQVEVIPHFAHINHTPSASDIARFKQKFGLREDHFTITCLGFVNQNKLPALQIEVVKRLIAEGYPVQMVFAGEPAPEVLDLFVESKFDGYAGKIICTGYLDEVDYFSSIFASDVIVNLRNPTMGESSGTLAHALAAGRPTIVSNVNQYKEFPDTVCWKLAHDMHEAETLLEYLRTLLREPKLRRAMWATARNFAGTVLSLDRVAQQWLNVLRASGRSE